MIHITHAWISNNYELWGSTWKIDTVAPLVEIYGQIHKTYSQPGDFSDTQNGFLVVNASELSTLDASMARFFRELYQPNQASKNHHTLMAKNKKTNVFGDSIFWGFNFLGVMLVLTSFGGIQFSDFKKLRPKTSRVRNHQACPTSARDMLKIYENMKKELTRQT